MYCSNLLRRATAPSSSFFASKPISLLPFYAARFSHLTAPTSLSPGCVESIHGGSHSSENFARGGLSGTSGLNFGLRNIKENVSVSPPFALIFRSYIHSSSQKDFETERNSRSMNFVRGIIEEDGRDIMGTSQFPRYNVEQNADIVHIKMLRNNTFVTVTDSKGNTKCRASVGCVPEMKGGAKMSRYAAEATAEHVGRMSRNLGLKSVVMKVRGLLILKRRGRQS